MAYQGWNLEAMRLTANDPPSLQNRRSPFTPMNYRLPVPSASSLDIVRGSEGGSIHELREDIASQSPENTAKRQYSYPTQSCKMPIAEMCGGAGLINSDMVAFGEPASKKNKKTTAFQRSQSVTISPSNKLSLDDNGAKLEQGLPLTATPDSFKQKHGKGGSAASRGKSRLNPAFKNPTITKPSLGQAKENKLFRSTSIVNHQGWRSTEESVKFTPVVLAQTTMERLSFFRFKSTPDPEDTSISLSKPHGASDRVAVDVVPNESLPNTAHLTSDYDFQTKESFYEDDFLNFNAHNKFNNGNNVQSQPSVGYTHNHETHKRAFEQPLAKVIGKTENKTNANSGASPLSMTNSSEGPHQRSDGFAELVEANSIISDPTFGEVYALANVTAAKSSCDELSQPAVACIEHQALTYSPESMNEVDMGLGAGSQCTAHNFLTLSQSEISISIGSQISANRWPNDLQNHKAQNYGQDHVNGFGQNSTLASPDDYSGLLKTRKCSAATYQQLERCKIDALNERPDITEPEAVSNEASKDLWGSDEFDENIDDDLLAIVSKLTVPQAQEVSHTPQQKKSKVYGAYLLSPQVVPDSLVFDSMAPAEFTADVPVEIQTAFIKGPPELNDDYPMDEGVEEELLKLTGPGSGNEDKFAPPESVEQAFMDLAEAEVYDKTLQFSPAKSYTSGASCVRTNTGSTTDKIIEAQSPGLGVDPLPSRDEENWLFIRSNKCHGDDTTSDPLNRPQTMSSLAVRPYQLLASTPIEATIGGHPIVQATQEPYLRGSVIDDSHKYEPITPFARPSFPTLVLDRSSVVGLSSQTCLRTCFRIGEMLKEGIHRASLGQDAVIELFCRVTFSSREPGSMKQHFQFSDLWHDRPPFSSGLLANFRTTRLAECESKAFLGKSGKMARCLGRFKRDVKKTNWILHIINIRETDWEEIRWTKEVVNHG